MLDYAPHSWQSQDDLHYGVCKTLLERGCRPVILHSGPIDPSVQARYLSAGIHLETCNYNLGLRYYLRQLRRIVRQYDIRLVDICFFDYFGFHAWLAKLAGVRSIVFTEVNSGTLRSFGWKRAVLRLRTGIMTAPVSHFVTISGFIRDRLNACGVPAEKTTVIHGGIDTGRFHPDDAAHRQVRQEFGLSDGELLLVSVNYLRPFKQVHVAIEACALLSARGIRYRYVIAGDGPCRKELEELAAARGISGQVRFLGHCKEPHRLLQAADLFLLASQGEAFGLAVTEAMACGAPVLGSRSGSLPELISDGETGLLAQPGDPASFADAIARMAHDPERLAMMRGQAREAAIRRFSVEREALETVKLYESLVAATPARQDA